MATGKFLNVKNSSIRNNKLYMFFPYEKHRLQFPCHQSLMMRCCDVICSWLKNNIVWFNKIDLIYSVQNQFKHEQRSMWWDCGQRSHLSLCIFAKVNINFFHLLIKSSGKNGKRFIHATLNWRQTAIIWNIFNWILDMI